MKILHVVQYFAPAWGFGGPPRAVYEIARRQVGLGHQVAVLTTDAFEAKGRLPPGETEVEGIRVVRARNVSTYVMWNLHFCTPPGLPRSLDVPSFDVMHVHEARTLINVLALRRVRPGQRVVFSPWGGLPHNDQLVLFKRVFDSLFLGIFRRTVHVGLGQNSHEVSVVERFGIGTSSMLLPLGIDCDFFRELPSRQVSRQQLGLDQTPFVFLFLGRFSRLKGIGLLIEAFARLQQDEPNVQLVLVGRDDGYLKRLHERIGELGLEEKVRVLGPLYDKDRLLAYAAADVFVHTPTVYEETSTACLEALACGTPTITTRQSAIPYLADDDGVRHVESDRAAIVAAMADTVKNGSKPVNRAKLWQFFDWQSIVQHLETIYDA